MSAPDALRVRALDGGDLARVCPVCDQAVVDEKVEVITSSHVVNGEIVHGYSTELEDANWIAHHEKGHE